MVPPLLLLMLLLAASAGAMTPQQLQHALDVAIDERAPHFVLPSGNVTFGALALQINNANNMIIDVAAGQPPLNLWFECGYGVEVSGGLEASRQALATAVH